ncbi:sensor histidine kinase [Methylibium sp.]|uniref:sensor histidine kinase n=1 Tax=Methylibium sp. TaxID=2067992 RepID=UPI003D13D800
MRPRRHERARAGRARSWLDHLGLAAGSIVWRAAAAQDAVAAAAASAQRDTWVIGAATVVMGALALLLAWRAQRPAYACFGAASLLWAARQCGWQNDLALAGSGWAPLAAIVFNASLAWIAALAGLYALATVGRNTPRVRRALLAWAALAFALGAAAVLLDVPALNTLLRIGSLAVVAGLLALLCRTAWQERTTAAVLLSAATALGLAVGVGVLWVPDAAAWSHPAALLLLAVVAWLLVDEFTCSHTALQSLNRELQDRVAQKERELQLAFEGTRQREHQQAVLAERDRILREMHDGLGGRLVAAMALTSQVERQSLPPPGGEPRSVDEPLRDLKLTLDDCLVELRLALDSLETDQRPLIEALAELRFRVEPSLRAAGVRLVWQVDDAASEVELPAAETLHVLRIVREALTNVIKHAHATVVWLRLEARGAQRLVLAVIDNGLQQRMSEAQVEMPLFVPPSLVHGGRGLANMQRRAAALSARLDSGPHPEGWAVTLELPVPGTAAA